MTVTIAMPPKADFSDSPCRTECELCGKLYDAEQEVVVEGLSCCPACYKDLLRVTSKSTKLK